MYGLALSRTWIKVCNHNGGYSIEAQVQFLFQDQTVSWIRIVNGIDNSHVDPRGRNSFGETRCKSVTNTKTVINKRCVNFIPIEHRKWMDIETQESNDPLLFSSVKIHHSTTTTQSKSSTRRWWSIHLCPYYWWMQEKQIRQNWILVSWEEEGIRQCSALVDWKMDIKRWRTKEKVSILFESERSSKKILYLRATQGHSGRTINPASMYFYHKAFPSIFITSETKKLRSVVNHGLIPGGVSLRMGRQAVFFTIVIPMDNQDGWGETQCDLSQARIAPYKNTCKRFQNTVFWCNFKLAQKRGLQFYQTRSNAVILYDTLLAEFTEKAICMKTKDQPYKVKAWFSHRVLFLKLTRNAVHKIYLYKKQDHFGNRNKMRRAREKPEATQLTTEYLVYRSQLWNCTMHGDKITSKSWLRCSRNISIRKNSLKTWVKSGRSTSSARNHNKYSPTWTKDRSSSFARSLQNINVLIAMPFSEIGIIYCSCGRNSKYSRSPVTSQKTNCDFTSIPGFVIENNSSRGPKHGVSERQVMFIKRKQMLKNTRQK